MTLSRSVVKKETIKQLWKWGNKKIKRVREDKTKLPQHNTYRITRKKREKVEAILKAPD